MHEVLCSLQYSFGASAVCTKRKSWIRYVIRLFRSARAWQRNPWFVKIPMYTVWVFLQFQNFNSTNQTSCSISLPLPIEDTSYIYLSWGCIAKLFHIRGVLHTVTAQKISRHTRVQCLLRNASAVLLILLCATVYHKPKSQVELKSEGIVRWNRL